jgi:hypothetical protein
MKYYETLLVFLQWITILAHLLYIVFEPHSFFGYKTLKVYCFAELLHQVDTC